jgi:hypothetical protein
MGKSQQKKKSFFDQVMGAFESNKAKADNPNRKKSEDNRPSIAERINFGGRGKELKRQRTQGRK